MRVRVIGVGSAFGDDAVGLAVVELLARRQLPAQITVARCERPMPDLLDALDEVEGIVLVDATRSGALIGSVRQLRAEEVTRAKATSSHGFGVASALLLAQTLGCYAARVEWVGIEAGPRRWGDPLSAAVAGALPEAAALALKLACEIAGLGARS
jgi:hydrogenase maturation protease